MPGSVPVTKKAVNTFFFFLMNEWTIEQVEQMRKLHTMKVQLNTGLN